MHGWGQNESRGCSKLMFEYVYSTYLIDSGNRRMLKQVTHIAKYLCCRLGWPLLRDRTATAMGGAWLNRVPVILATILTTFTRPTSPRSPYDNMKYSPQPPSHSQKNSPSWPHIAPLVATTPKSALILPQSKQNNDSTYQFLVIVKARPQDIIFGAHSQNWNGDALEVLEFWLDERDAVGLITALPCP